MSEQPFELKPGDREKLEQIAASEGPTPDIKIVAGFVPVSREYVKDLLPAVTTRRSPIDYSKVVGWLEPRSRMRWWRRARRAIGRQLRRIPIRVVWLRREDEEDW